MKREWRTTKNGHWIDPRNVMEALRKRLHLDFSSSFSFSSQMMLNPFPSAPTPIYRKMGGGGCDTARPGEQVASHWSFLMGPGGPRGWRMPLNWPFCPYFEYFAHFLPKRRKTLRIAQQLVLSSSIRPERIQILTNNLPWTKLGYDNCPSLLIFYWI